MNIQQIGSTNFDLGRQGHVPSRVVIHIMDGTLVGCDSWFNNPASQVSAHYGIGKNGDVHQYVQDWDTAWACAPYANPTSPYLFPDLNPNLYTINVEFEGFSGDALTQEQLNSFAELIKEKGNSWNVTVDRIHILGHCEINSVSRANCPGVNLDDFVNQINTILTVAPTPTPTPVPDPLEAQILALQAQAIKDSETIKQTGINLADATSQIIDLKNQITVLGQKNASLQIQLSSFKPLIFNLFIKSN